MLPAFIIAPFWKNERRMVVSEEIISIKYASYCHEDTAALRYPTSNTVNAIYTVSSETHDAKGYVTLISKVLENSY